ncbi:DUF3168 domain-containing protein [Streptomyces sp. NPDC058644]|uniref:DUF3168 domain-containing protein n=1 Tax=unclassified Streptomyces TaxID=2593676 RepID=UPI003651E137
MATALRPLQSAIYARLTASAPLMALVSGVYDEVPENAAFPYVSFGSITETLDDAHDRQGLEAMVVIHVWSKAPGMGEAYDVFAAVDAALDRVPLAVFGFTDVSIRHESHEALKDPDPEIRHINAQYGVRLTAA